MVIETMIAGFILSHSKAPTAPVYTPPPEQVSYGLCVAERESNGRPEAVNPTGKYRGKYQFSEELKDGATWMMLDWIRTWHPRPLKYAAYLRATPMNEWPERVQDAAFFETLNHEGEWSGRAHWAGGRWKC